MEERKTLTFLDFFAGIGGFRKGMEMAGHKCVGFCENDKYAVASYTSMHLLTEEQRKYLATLNINKRQKEILKEEYRNGEWYASDIRAINAQDIPRADCWCFGFPCQDISNAKKQPIGFYGSRSSLFFRVMYLLGQQDEEKKPTYLFIENVKNLLGINGGWDFARLLVEMDRNGYDAEWQVLNSKYFGVPQNRERCFIIGHLRGRSSTEILPVERTSEANRVFGIGHRKGYRRNTQIFDKKGITEVIDTATGGGRGLHTVEIIDEALLQNNEKNQLSISVQLLNNITVDAIWHPEMQQYIAIRKLTPKEYFRLQGWDDESFDKAQFVNSDSQLYKQAGNGVTVNVIYEIAKKLEIA